MERTHCGLYQAAATDDCKDIVTSGKLLKLIRVFHGVSQSTLAGRTGYHPRNPTNLKATGQNPGHESFGPCARHWQLSAGFSPKPSVSYTEDWQKRRKRSSCRQAGGFFVASLYKSGDGQSPWGPARFHSYHLWPST